ncbi:glycoside hydrolase family 43 protein [Ligilactobacillus sp. WILCCON 0076]|uniref:Glycoside hydrolase family 43 protein n=1 Tax=Ligilactobacillus ubinensis TaxID=2876789 RepID=A0A9X2FK27_9LACO|nr:glycoside hydrolase family 43 protein [Ligilactobacillus ubinensis]MCP0887027.1 glycoside hydrolase family 43 protein [Ligilactobacillus ubinensis]
MKAINFKNPIIKGFHPDPSICAVGKNFYLVNSTFSYFPGIPIFHSTDLVHWKQIGNALTRKSQVDLSNNEDSEGIYAPTIRFHNGLFYIISSNEAHGGVFIITATNPKGPWSDPTFIKDADGIDPSLYFENKKIFYVGTHNNSKGTKFFGDNEIYLVELNTTTLQFKGKVIPLWNGALRNVVWPEGPHIYKKGGYYYLLIAEGGTESHHSITIARSKELTGPYESNPDNPILTHRNMGNKYNVANVGHGDFVKAFTNDWYFVCLGSRKCENVVNTGRETFLGHISWENNWPVLNPGMGILEKYGKIFLPENNISEPRKTINFSNQKFDNRLLFLRNPKEEKYKFNINGNLVMKSSNVKLSDLDSPTFIGLRQCSMFGTFEASFGEIHLLDSELGLTIYQNHKNNLNFFVKKEKIGYSLNLAKFRDGTNQILLTKPLNITVNKLIVKQNAQQTTFGYVLRNSQDYHWFNIKVDTKFLSTEIAGGFTGCVRGIYISSTSVNTSDYVELLEFNVSEDQ